MAWFRAGSLSVLMRSEDPSHILVVAPNWLGDAAMATPVFRVLKRRFPEARLVVAGTPAVCALLEGSPWLDVLHVLPARSGMGALCSCARAIRTEGRPDLALLLPHSFRSALLAYLAGARRRMGYDRGGRRLLLTNAVQPHRENGVMTPIYMVQEYLTLAAATGAVDDGVGLELAVDPVEEAHVAAHLAGTGPLVGIAPGAAFGPSKRWLPERFAQAADALAVQRGARCVLITGPGEEETRDAVRTASQTPLLECPGGGITRLKAIISRLDLLICNDSGPRHIAVAFKKPVICIMGSTSPKYTDSPWEMGRVIRVDVDCGPCQRPVCTTDHRCMILVGVDRVVEAALEFLPS